MDIQNGINGSSYPLAVGIKWVRFIRFAVKIYSGYLNFAVRLMRPRTDLCISTESFDNLYRASYKPWRIFGNDNASRLTWVSCVLPKAGGVPLFSTRNRQLAWLLCRVGCIVNAEIPQDLRRCTDYRKILVNVPWPVLGRVQISSTIFGLFISNIN